MNTLLVLWKSGPTCWEETSCTLSNIAIEMKLLPPHYLQCGKQAHLVVLNLALTKKKEKKEKIKN